MIYRYHDFDEIKVLHKVLRCIFEGQRQETKLQ